MLRALAARPAPCSRCALPVATVSFRIHGVSADFIRAQEKKGRKNLSAEELIDLRIHGGR